MSILPFLFFVLAPMLLALTGQFWIWWLPTFSKLRKRAPSLDTEFVPVRMEAPGITIKTLRNSQRIGDKIVVTHHLIKAVEDLLDSLRTGAVFTTVGTVIVVLLVCLQNQGSLILAGESQGPQDLISALTTIFSRVPQFYSVPIGQATGLLFFIGALLFLWKQAKKYI